jgi:selenocysteine lyase/cysteine desulfurase
MDLDINFVRAQFDQLGDDPELVFASNAGGSFMCNQVSTLMDHYNRHTRVQPYSNFKPSSTAGEAMDRAKQSWAAALNVAVTELTIGPSTSINTYVMSHSIGENWQAGDEIVVTNQDHEANIGVWRRKAVEKGVSIREWRVDPDTGLLDVNDLVSLLNDDTKWVFFTQCSNIVGTLNPVAEISTLIRKHCAARIFVDAVSYAPHHICDMKALGVDAYVFSLYKVFGPHQSLLYTSESLQGELASQAHFFLAGDAAKSVNPSGPQHAQVAACGGVIDYFDTLYRHHFPDGDAGEAQKMQDIHGLLYGYEKSLAEPILDYLGQHSDIRLLGKASVRDDDRAATIAFMPLKQSSESLTATLQEAGIGTEYGDFYAPRLLEGVGIDPAAGVVRLSLVHYNKLADVERILTELDRALLI